MFLLSCFGIGRSSRGRVENTLVADLISMVTSSQVAFFLLEFCCSEFIFSQKSGAWQAGIGSVAWQHYLGSILSGSGENPELVPRAAAPRAAGRGAADVPCVSGVDSL